MSRVMRFTGAATALVCHRGIHYHGEAIGVIIIGVVLSLMATFSGVATIRPDYALFNLSTGTAGVNYSIEQEPTFIIDTTGLISADKPVEAVRTLSTDEGAITAKVLTGDGKAVNVTSSINSRPDTPDEFIVSVSPDNQPAPGKYTMQVTITSRGKTQTVTQDFTWGVLALNLNQSTYRPNEKAFIGMAVLDDRGVTLCDAKTTLEITHPNKTVTTLSTDNKKISISDTCQDKSVTDKPDYIAEYVPEQEGEYSVKLTAETKNGLRTMQTTFEVTRHADFVTTRDSTAMRLYPAVSYDVKLKLKAERAITGSIQERVPNSFTVTRPQLVVKQSNGQVREEVSNAVLKELSEGVDTLLRWEGVSMQAGDTAYITYTYQPPFISPAFYSLGPTILADSKNNIAFEEPRAWQLASDATGDVILLWDTANGAIPSGWTCLSCTSGDAFFQLFPRAASSYSGTPGGGPESVTHPYSIPSVAAPTPLTVGLGGPLLNSLVVGSNVHAHTFGNPTIGSSDIKPPYQNLKFIKASNPLSLPQDAIAMFDVSSTASLPTNWTSYTPMNDPSSTGSPGNGVYLRGENDNNAGGAATHNHTRTAVTSGGPSTTFTSDSLAADTPTSTNAHTHTLAAGNTTSENNDPSYISVVFARLTVDNDALPDGLLAFFDNSSLPLGWSQKSTLGGNSLADRLVKGSSTAGTTGGRTTHNHGGSQAIITGAPSATNSAKAAITGGTTAATSTHTHNVTYTVASGNSMPAFRDAIIGRFTTIDISGTVYSDEGATTLGSQPVKAAITGIGQRSTTAAADGTYTMTVPDPGVGGVITAWLDTNGGNSGATTTRSNQANITGLDIYQNRLVATHEDAGALSNTNVGVCDKTTGAVCADSDLHFDESSGSLTVDNDWRLYIKDGKTFTPGGGVMLSPSSSAAGVGGDLKWGSSGSTLNIAANALSVGGDWVNTAGGTFTKSAGQTTTLTATGSGFTVDASSKNFEKLTFNGAGGVWSFTPAATAVNVDNDLTITNGNVTAPSVTLNTGGNWSNAGTFVHNSGTVTFMATATGKTINPGASSFNNLTFNGVGGAWSPLTNTVTALGDLTMTAGTFDTSNGTANVIVNGHVQGTAGVINMTATNTFTQRVASDKNFGATSGNTTWTFNNLTFSNSSGTGTTIATQTGGTGALTINGNLVTSSTGDTASTALDAGNRTWKLGNINGVNPFDLDQAGGTLTAATSTFEYAGDNDAGNVTVENTTYNHLTLGGPAVESYSPEGATSASGNLLINANATLIGTQNVTVNGTVNGAGTITLTGGVFLQSVAAAQDFGSTSGSNDWTFNDLRFENSAGANFTITLSSTGTGKVITNGTLTVGNAADTNTLTIDNQTNDRVIDANSNYTITSKGSYTASSTAAFTIGGSYLNNGSLTAGAGTTTFDATTSGKTLAGSMTDANKFHNLTFNGSGGGWSFGVNSADAGNNFTITNGTVAAPSTTLIVTNNYSNAGTFTHNSGLVVFNATATGKTINPGTSSPFFNLHFSGAGGGWTIQTNTATIAGDLLLIAGTLGSSVDITANGNVQCAGTCGTMTIGGGTFTHSTSANKSFGTNVAVGTNWTFSNLTFDAAANSPTITLNSTGTGSIIVSGNLALTKAGGASALTVDDSTNNRILDVNGDVAIAASTTLQAPSSASFTVGGSWLTSGALTHNSGTVTFDSTATGKTIDAGSSSFFNLTFSGSGGGWSPRANTLVVLGNITMTSGTLGAVGDTADITVNGNATGTAGIINITASGRTFRQRVASDKSFGATTAGTNWTFADLTFSNSNGTATPVTMTTNSGTGTMTVSGVLRVGASGDATGATTALDAGSRSWILSGTGGTPFQMLASPTGSFTASTSTVNFTGNNGSGNTSVPAVTYYKLVVNNSSETFDAASAIVVNSDLTVTAGTFALTGNNLTVGSSGVTNSGGISVASSATLSQATSSTTAVRSSSGGSATIGGAGSITFYNLTFDPLVASGPTFTLGSAASQTINISNNLTVGNGTNGVTVTATTNDPVIDVNGNATINNNGTLIASDSAAFRVAGSWANSGTFTHSSGTVTFDAGATGRTIVTGGTGAGKDFNKVLFNNGSGGWTIQANNMTTASDLTITAVGALTLESGRTLEVKGTYSACDTCMSNTTWTGSTLFLNAGTAYTVGSKSQDTETYGTLQIGANTDIRSWKSDATTVTVDASGSLYSQNHANANGTVNVYGDYHVTGTDYWSYSTDFDGTALSGASQRQVTVKIETSAGRGVTVDSTKTLNIKGGGAGTNQFTDVNRISGASTYQLVSSGSANVQEAKITNANFNGGTWAPFNTVVSGHTVSAGTLTIDWYLGIHAVDRDVTSTDIDTAAAADITVAETSGAPAATVFKMSGGSWGSAAITQTNDSGTNGHIAQPNSDGALRVREYSQTSGATTHYRYNLTIKSQGVHADYDYFRDYGDNYITSTGSPAGSGVDKVIGSGWYRDTIATENTHPTVNEPPATGTWYVGMAKAILAMWDTADGAIPSGWSCVSCVSGDAYFQKFLRATATYGGTGGGVEVHGHDLTAPSATAGASFVALNGVTNVAVNTHTHTWAYGAGDDTASADIKPPYQNLKIIRGPNSGPKSWPVNVISPFRTATVPSGWAAYTALNASYPRGENTNTTGGAATHMHNTNALTSGAASGTAGIACVTGCSSAASATHTHNLAATALTTVNNDPLHVNVRFMKHTDTSLPPADLLGLFDHTSFPGGYTIVSNASPYQNNLLTGATTSIEGTGGASTHDHGGSKTITAGAPSATATAATGVAVNAATATHSHNVTYTVGSKSLMPDYRDVVVAKFTGSTNANPADPSSLLQKKTSDATIATGGWINETSVKFTASATDPDNPEQLQLCIEVKTIATAFDGSGENCGSLTSYSGSTITVDATVGSLTNGSEYHWQARVKDDEGGVSGWVGYGGNAENPPTNPAARDFGVDTSAPSTAAVFDNTNIESQPSNTDTDQNADGLLTTLSATWADFDADVSGLAKYEYSIGTAVGGTDIKAWTDNSATRFKRDTTLTLQTNKLYYYNVRATDNAGNVSSVASSNGQIVTPTLTFDIDVDAADTETSPPYSVDFGGLAPSVVANSPKKIWIDFETNGVAGGRVYVAGLNAGLRSVVTSHTITSATGNLAVAASGFGAQGSSATQVSGGPFSINSPYDGSSDDVGLLNATFQNIFTTSNPLKGGRGSFLLKAKPSDLTPASNDYSETLIVIAAGTY